MFTQNIIIMHKVQREIRALLRPHVIIIPPSFHFSDCAPAFVAPQGRSEETARRLWDISCELLGIEWD